MNAAREGGACWCAVSSEVGEFGGSLSVLGVPEEEHASKLCEGGPSIVQKGRSAGDDAGRWSWEASMILILISLLLGE
jgi:hypothetical protein